MKGRGRTWDSQEQGMIRCPPKVCSAPVLATSLSLASINE
jgi:hypothetical protein